MSGNELRAGNITAHRTGPGGVILMDAECVLCNRFARFVIRHDRKGLFLFAPKRSAAARYFQEDVGFVGEFPETIVLLHEGRVYLYSDVSLQVLGGLGFPWSMAACLRFVPKALRDAAYLLVSRNRYRLFGRTTACGLLSPEEQRRVIWE